MATVAARVEESNNAGVVQITWETLTDADSGAAVDISAYTDMTVHSDGSYTGSGSITMQGSNNNVAWFSLTKPGGTAISLTADTVGAYIVEEPRYIRPTVVSGDGSTDIDVIVTAKRRAY